MCNGCEYLAGGGLAVVPVLVGPLQTLLALLPAILWGLAGLLLAVFRPRILRTLLVLLWRQKVAVALLVGVVAGAAYGLPHLFRDRGAHSAGSADATDWPMFRGTQQRCGITRPGADPITGGTHWAFIGESTFYSSPAIVGDRLYAISAGNGLFTDSGAIYCLDANTGQVIWKSAPPGYRASFSSPAVSGRYLVCGEGLHTTLDGRILCLDTGSGQVLWEMRTNSHVESSACISGSRVIIGAGDDGYYCLALSGNGHGGPQVLWHAMPDKYPDAESSPLIVDGRVYIGLGEAGQAICCLDADTGQEIWRTPTPCPVFTAPTMIDGKILIGMGIGNYVKDEQQVRQERLDQLRRQGATQEQLNEALKDLPLTGAIWCLNADDGKLLWSFDTSATVLGAVAAMDNGVCFASRDGHVVLLSLEGKELARWHANDPILASPALTDDHVYVTTASGHVYGLSLSALLPVWETSISGTGLCLSSPAIAGGHVYTGSGDAGLLCLGQGGVEQRAEIWAGPLGGPGGSVTPGPIARSGQYLWSFDAGNPSPTRITGPAARLGDRLYVPVLDGPRKGVACLKLDAKDVQAHPELWFARTTLGVAGSPAVAPQTTSLPGIELNPPGPAKHIVFFVEGRTGELGRRLHCVDGETGKTLWNVPVDPHASGQMLLASGRVVLQDMPDSLACLGYDGKVNWRQKTGVLSGSPAAADDVLLTAADGVLTAWDLPTGTLLWRAAIGQTCGGPVPLGNRIYVPQEDGIGAYNLLDGSKLWAASAGRPASPVTTNGHQLSYVSDKGQVLVLDLAGQTLQTFEQALPVAAPLFCGDQLIYASSAGILAADLDKPGNPRRWLRTARYGAICSPLISTDSRLYFATENGGFICAGTSGAGEP